jgi:hypothetical protein
MQKSSSLSAWPLIKRPIGCPETSVLNYDYMLREIPLKADFKPLFIKKKVVFVIDSASSSDITLEPSGT